MKLSFALTDHSITLSARLDRLPWCRFHVLIVLPRARHRFWRAGRHDRRIDRAGSAELRNARAVGAAGRRNGLLVCGRKWCAAGSSSARSPRGSSACSSSMSRRMLIAAVAELRFGIGAERRPLEALHSAETPMLPRSRELICDERILLKASNAKSLSCQILIQGTQRSRRASMGSRSSRYDVEGNANRGGGRELHSPRSIELYPPWRYVQNTKIPCWSRGDVARSSCATNKMIKR